MSPSWKLLLAVVGVGVSIVVVGLVALAGWGLGLYEDEVCEHLKAQSAIVEKLGPVSGCDQRLLATSQIGDFDTFVFAVEGPRGQGRAFVKSTSTGEDGAEIYQGILLVVGGEELLIQGERPPTR